MCPECQNKEKINNSNVFEPYCKLEVSLEPSFYEESESGVSCTILCYYGLFCAIFTIFWQFLGHFLSQTQHLWCQKVCTLAWEFSGDIFMQLSQVVLHFFLLFCAIIGFFVLFLPYLGNFRAKVNILCVKNYVFESGNLVGILSSNFQELLCTILCYYGVFVLFSQNLGLFLGHF